MNYSHHTVVVNRFRPISTQSKLWQHHYLLPSVFLVLLYSTISPEAIAQCQQGCDLGKLNTFLGDKALVSNTTGVTDVAVGESALANNTVGNDNTAVGADALVVNSSG